MLMMIGPVRLEVQPLNLMGYEHSHQSAFAAKPIAGAQEALEWVGEGAETWSLKAKLFPRRFGGLGGLELLGQARAAGLPQYMMRGDGALMGWVVIDQVQERSTYLDASGVGRVVEVDISLRRAAAPDAASYFSVMAGVFQ